MPATETWNKRVMAPIQWGRPYAWECLIETCPNVMRVERIEEGQIWECHGCHAKHEFYNEYKGVAGGQGYLKFAVVRLLIGDHRREGSEPVITEFMDPVK